ncbi:hypothetical protein ACFQJC_04905 [Haloferax namakaokahaiae]|uniref:Uncharacterized protein n=1 Tax=Haloferax namakaokahaiae TaxID=1748331 RepID=A0ABD5ZCB7_9EURY
MSNDTSVVHRKGFTKIRGTRYESVSGERVRIERQERMHKFGSGYQNTGPAVPIFTGTVEDARHVYEVLQEWFDE